MLDSAWVMIANAVALGDDCLSLLLQQFADRFRRVVVMWDSPSQGYETPLLPVIKISIQN